MPSISARNRTSYAINTVAIASGKALCWREGWSKGRFVTAAGFHSNSWDTHAKNDEGHRARLCPPLDRTLSVLLDDLDQHGLFDSTIVLAMGEFGARRSSIRTWDAITGPPAGRSHSAVAASRADS
jgi:uncharacterized protein (DUF1501 family)